jgi:predicted nucleotidyltransferase
VGDIDLIGEVPGLGVYETVKANSEEVELYGYQVYVLTVEALIVTKEAAGRPKDLRLLPELKALRALHAETPQKKK